MMRKYGFMGLLLLLLSTVLWVGFLEKVSNAQEPTDGVPPGYMIIEGDIIVPEDFYDRGGIGIQSAFGDTNFWPNGIVPYVFDANVTATNQALMLAAMAEWESVANVDFRPRNGEGNRVRIRDSTGDANPTNSSPVGMTGGEQIINIVSWNNRWIMAHELAHALGFWHEQSRPDRNSYVQINTSNIQTGLGHNFDIRTAADVYPIQVYGLNDDQTYDFDSVMHYGQCDFSTDCPLGASCNCTNTTITVLAPNQVWQTQIGQRNHLSTLDQLTMSFIYPESNWRFVDRTYIGSTADGNFLTPYKQFTTAMNNMPNNSILWLQPGTYSAVGVYNKPSVLEAPLGNVALGQ